MSTTSAGCLPAASPSEASCWASDWSWPGGPSCPAGYGGRCSGCLRPRVGTDEQVHRAEFRMCIAFSRCRYDGSSAGAAVGDRLASRRRHPSDGRRALWPHLIRPGRDGFPPRTRAGGRGSRSDQVQAFTTSVGSHRPTRHSEKAPPRSRDGATGHSSRPSPRRHADAARADGLCRRGHRIGAPALRRGVHSLSPTVTAASDRRAGHAVPGPGSPVSSERARCRVRRPWGRRAGGRGRLPASSRGGTRGRWRAPRRPPGEGHL